MFLGFQTIGASSTRMAPSARKMDAAVSAMEKLGIHWSTTRPVLIKLLKKHKNRWKPIENANYHLLIDSIFEMQGEEKRRDAADSMALDVAGVKLGRGSGRQRKTEIGQSSNLVAKSAAEVPRETSDSQCYRRRLRPRTEMAAVNVCIKETSSQFVDVGVGSCSNTKNAWSGINETELDPARTRKVDPEDIANGCEMLTISVANGVDVDIPYFKYIRENIVCDNARVKTTLAQIGDDRCCRGCYGDCMDALSLCACRQINGGEYAYTSEGLVRKEILKCCIFGKRNLRDDLLFCKICPLERAKDEINRGACKGHLRRIFIKECWRKCGCFAYCGNRVVQRRMYPKMELFYCGKKKGWGLRTLEELPRGAFVCEYVGEVLTIKEYCERTTNANANGKQIRPMILDANWAFKDSLNDEDALCLDATVYGNIARFINHRCYDANLVDIPVEIETPEHHYYHVAFFTTRNIKINEELNWDYGIDFDDRILPTEAFKCYCGSRHCRRKKIAAKANNMIDCKK